MIGKLTAAFVLLLCLSSLGGTQEKAGEVKLDVVKYDGLKEIILKNRGKVVLVDFWFNT